MEQDSRNQILNKIKQAIKQSPYKLTESSINEDDPIFHNIDDNLAITFAKELQKVDGKFIFCVDNKDLIESLQQIVEEEKWETVFCANKELHQSLLDAEIPFTGSQDDFHQMQVAITGCEYLIARFGSVMVSSAQITGRQLNVYPPVHIVIAKSSQLVAEIEDGLNNLSEKYKNNFPSMVSIITGPSRTADIEKTLILGAHGPKDLYVFLVDDLS